MARGYECWLAFWALAAVIGATRGTSSDVIVCAVALIAGAVAWQEDASEPQAHRIPSTDARERGRR